MEVCGICHVNEAKYRCPACGIKTCSVDCINRHKKQTECTGTLEPSRFIPKHQLSQSPVHINRDYNFLTKLGRDIVVGKSDIKTQAKNVFKRSNGPRNRSKRVKRSNEPDPDPRVAKVHQCYPMTTNPVIRRMNTMVIQFPEGMSRASNNKSGYDKKLLAFTWTIEWVFVDKTVKEFLSYRINEALALKDAVPMTILKTVNPEVETHHLRFYLSNVFDNHSFIELDPSGAVCEALKDAVVLEYPTIHVTTTTYSSLVSKQDAYQLSGHGDSSASESSDSDSSDSDSSDSGSSDSDSDSSGASESDPESDPESGSSDGAPEEHSSKAPDHS